MSEKIDATDMPESVDIQHFVRIAQRIDPQSRLLRTWRLTGGVSAEVTVLEIERPDGRRQKLLVRRHGPVDLAHNPRIARDEFRLLEITRSHGLATPEPYLFDESGAILPSPFIVIEFIDGDTDFAPADLSGYVRQMAEQLTSIHRIRATADLSFLPEQDKGFGPRPDLLDESMSENQIRDALEAHWPVTQMNESMLLHGDYWPGGQRPLAGW
jgi:aminoglycoside phosphotransferase (APT) family kinase protein